MWSHICDASSAVYSVFGFLCCFPGATTPAPFTAVAGLLALVGAFFGAVGLTIPRSVPRTGFAGEPYWGWRPYAGRLGGQVAWLKLFALLKALDFMHHIKYSRTSGQTE